MKPLKKIIGILLCTLFAIGLIACGNSGSNAQKGLDEVEKEQYELHLIIEYETNVLFAKYDIDIYVDKDKIGFVSQGQTFDYSLMLDEGNHTITVKNTGDSSEKASTSITLEQDKVYQFSLKSHTSSIDIKSQSVMTKKEYEKQLEAEKEAEKEAGKEIFTEEDTTDATVTNEEAALRTEIDANLNTYIGKTVSELIPYVGTIGYTAKYTAQNTGDDFTDWLGEDPSIGDNFIIQSITTDHVAKTLQVYWLGTETLADQAAAGSGSGKSLEDTLNEKLDEFVAWQAVVDYGRNIYGSKFKVHYIMDKQAAKADDANTWFLKAGCTMPEGQNLTVEANVTGTDDYPQVTYFIVY